MEDKFNDLGVDAIVGSDLMYRVGLTEQDLVLPGKELPPEQRSHMMSKVLTGKNVNKLEHLWGYVELTKKSLSKKKELDLLNEELSFYE